MYVIIGGCGRLGSSLAKLFSIEGDEVVIIDKNESSFDRLTSEFDGTKINGDLSEQGTLKDAGADKADVLIAVTNDDNTNIVGCQMGKEIFNVNKTIARINEPKHEEAFSGFNIDRLITPSKEIATLFKNAALNGNYSTRLILGDSDIEFIEVRANDDLGSVKELDIPEDFKLDVIKKNGNAKFISEDDVVKEGDRLYFLVPTKALKKNKDWFKKWR